MTSNPHTTLVLSIVIVSYNTRELMGKCLDSIREADLQIPYEIIVVDNASKDGTVEWLKEQHPEVILIANQENRMFGPANNQAMELFGKR